MNLGVPECPLDPRFKNRDITGKVHGALAAENFGVKILWLRRRIFSVCRIIRPEKTFLGRQVPCGISYISRVKFLQNPYVSLRSVRPHDIPRDVFCSDLGRARTL